MPLPPLLMTSDPGSFARRTIVERKRQIISRVITDNAYPPEIVSDLHALRDEIAKPGGGSNPIQPLRESVGDASHWNTQLTRHTQGHPLTWLEVPWYFAETYFYRRLLEAVRYFQPGHWARRDPFAAQKRAQEAKAVDQLGIIWPAISATPTEARFTPLLHAALWGNRADLSNFTVEQQSIGDTTTDQDNILIDHTAEAHELLDRSLREVAVICDNVGADTLFDLVLADYLMTTSMAQRVVLHLKNQPFFVSDALTRDMIEIIVRLKEADPPDLAALGERLNIALVAGDLVLTTHPFWTQALGFRDLPDGLRAQLETSDLVILKGDVNYRRLLDDRHWPPTTPLSVAAGDFPRPFLILRTLKGEIIAGLAPGQATALDAEDPTWLINGKRGLVQLQR